MGQKNKQNNQGDQKDGNNDKKSDGGGKNNVTVVLKTDIHCDGCASKIIKCIRSFGGVDTVTIGDGQKITVVGIVDPAKLREKLEQKTHKKVEIISPQPKKDGDNKDNANGKQNGGGGDNAKQPEKKNESKDQKSNEKPKEKEPPVTTAVLKVHLHCDGCIQKIYKTITKTKGYQDMKIDKQKDLVTVTGAMDMKALAETLQKQLKKNVEIVPPKKENEQKEKGGGGGEKGNNGGDGGGGGNGGDAKMEGNKMMMQQQSQMAGNPYPLMYGPGVFSDQFQQYHAPQMFSDENPNACAVM